jgi:clan AA aspartic protease
MNTFHVQFEIGNPAATRFEEIEALVDTGSTFSAAPREVLERLGIRPTRREPFEIASGEIVESDVGEAVVRIAGKQGTTPVIFNEPGEPTLLGAVTLEELLLGVDPVRERLIPIGGLRMRRRDI